MLRSIGFRRAMACFALLGAIASAACGGAKAPEAPAIVSLRKVAPESDDPNVVARWLVGEMLSPGGQAKRAIEARKRLDDLGGNGAVAHFARGLDDALHGRPAASDHYMKAVQAARSEGTPEAPLIAWFSVNRAITLRHETTGLWERWRTFAETAIKDPRNIGWRARSELVEWALEEAWTTASQDVKERAVKQFGCLTKARLAGPFGRGAASDAYRSYLPERPGPWPARWEPEPYGGSRPKVVAKAQDGCAITAATAGEGVFYVESFFDLPHPREVLVAVQGALAVWVDDAQVLERDLRQWAVWPRFGAQMMLPAGRHRVLARLGEPSTSIRLMRPDGTPLDVPSSDDPRAPYSLIPPRITTEPNLVSRYVRDGKVVDPGDDLTRFVAAFLAHVESSNDLASVLIEPLVADTTKATGPALTMGALFAEGDPLFDRGQTEDLIRELNERAVERDPGLWQAELSRILGGAEREGEASQALGQLKALARRFPEVSAIALTLARIYGELGWSAEHRQAVLAAVERFPDDLEVLHAAVEIHDAEGARKKADALVEHVRRLDADTEIVLTRALAREDYDLALSELKRMGERRPDHKELAERLFDVMVRAGNTSETWKKLEAAIENDPSSGRARLELADARFASGQHDALRRALAEAVVAGADTSLLSNAIDLVDGMTALESYRLDPAPIIAAYEASGQHMPGNAARVLDYAAIWARSDGSSQMLEHEIVRLQSAEGIQQFAEHRRLEGLVLRMRVIKQDGTTLEPEDVAGKPTVTFPHLEVGDYIETEQVVLMRGDGSGDRYIGPRWFFREENVAYARSELVVVTPRHKDVIIETTGQLPAPKIVEDGALVSRRWRVDFSPAAPVEPHGVPATEFLPSVRIGWGVSLEDHLTRLSDAVADVTPTDPRIERVARRIIEDAPKKDVLGQARRLYRWVLDNVEPGEESDGRRIVIARRGNRWRAFLELCEAVGVDARYAVAKNRLAAPPDGPISLAAQFTEPVIRVAAGKQEAWVSLNQKFAPFGYVPAEVRGMEAFLLDGSAKTAVTLPEKGDEDGLWFEGKGKLGADGSLELELVERFTGKLAMALRSGISQLPEQRLKAALESNLLQRALSGARLKEFKIEARDRLDEPLAVRMKVSLDRFARVDGERLVISPPFVLALSTLTALPSRQTPLLIGESIHRRVELTLELPKGATADIPHPADVTEEGRSVRRDDAIEGQRILLKRSIEVPAARIQPRKYADFARFAERADELQTAPVVVKL